MDLWDENRWRQAAGELQGLVRHFYNIGADITARQLAVALMRGELASELLEACHDCHNSIVDRLENGMCPREANERLKQKLAAVIARAVAADSTAQLPQRPTQIRG